VGPSSSTNDNVCRAFISSQQRMSDSWGRPTGRPLWPPGSSVALSSSDSRYDVIVIGSGFGGAMAAHAPVLAGARVLMLERGGWVDRGPHNWEPRGAMELIAPSIS